MFVALGVGVFLGIYWSGPALERAASSEFDKGLMYNVQIVYPYGLTNADLDAIGQIEGVSYVEPARQTFAVYKHGQTDMTFKLQTLGDWVNYLDLKDGRMPRKPDEIALKATAASALGLGVRDQISFVHDAADDDPDGMAQLTVDTFTIAAIVESPEYISYTKATYGISLSGSGSVDELGWVLPEAFDDDAYYGGYPIANILCTDLKGMNSFSEEYIEASSRVERDVTALGAELAPARYNDLRSQAEQAIADGEEQLGPARDILAIAQRVLKGVDETVTPLLDRISEETGLTGGPADVIAAAHDLVDRGARYVADGEAKLEAGKAQLASLKEYDWIVTGRQLNGGALEASMFAGVTERLAFTMAALFLIVGLLVTYSAVSRLVHEQITQIGTKKALGLRGREITASFLAYSALAVVVGAIIGTIVGIIVVEGILGYALGQRFTVGGYPPYVGLPSALAIVGIELVLVLAVTWMACRRILREHAVELLRGEKPPQARGHFYERLGIWDKLPLLSQTIVNNCVNDKRRVFSTIVGVAGCTALIVTAITLNDDVLASYDAHYDHVFNFDTIVNVDSSVDDAANSVDAALHKAGVTNTAQIHRQNFMLILPNGSRSSMRAVVPTSAEEFGAVYHVNPVPEGSFDLNADGVWVCQAYASHIGAQVGDEILLNAGDGVVHRVPIAGFYEFYLPFNELIMNSALYEEVFGTSPAPNMILADAAGMSTDEMKAALGGTPGFDGLVNDKKGQKGNFNSFASVSNIVVLVYLGLATLMAIVVLLNLNVMFIEEKRRELIVLMINGFSVHDAKRYIYNDSIVLTLIGIVLGLVLGSVMGSLTVGSIEFEAANFLKGIAWRAIVIGAVGSAALATIMGAIALRRIPNFNLTDINRF